MNLLQRLLTPFRTRTGGQAWNKMFDAGSSAGTAITRPFATSAWVHSAIRIVADPISHLPIIFTQDRRGGDITLDLPELTAFWQRPAATRAGRMNATDFIWATCGWLKLRGEAFWLLDDTWLTRTPAKSPLILARPQDLHEITTGKGRELIGWHYTDAFGTKHALIPEQVIHLKFWNPYDEIRGLAEWEAAAIAADSDYAAGLFARNLARNNGDRGPYVIGKNGVASDEQQKQITAMLRQKREMASRGDFRAVFLTGDIEVKEPTLQAVDAAYVTQRLENRKEVYIAFGVPPSFADSQASYSIGSASDRFKLIEETCMPLAAKIADAIEQVSTRLIGSTTTLFAEFDWDEHSTMQAVRAERFDSATKAIDRGMPWKDASQYFRLNLPRFPGDEVGRVPFNLQEISGSVGVPPTSQTPSSSETSDPEAEDPAAQLTQLFAARRQSPCTCAANPAQKSAEWSRIHKPRQPWEKRFESKVRRLLMDARAETLRNIGAAQTLQARDLSQKFSATDLIFDLTKWLGTWTTALTTLSRNALETAGFQVWSDELLRDDPLTMPAGEIVLAVAARKPLIQDVATKIHADINAELQASILAGDTLPEIAQKVKTKFSAISDSRAQTIARTETTYAYETGRDIAFRAAGVQWTQWLTIEDGGERHPSYTGLNKQIRPIDEPFTLYGSLTLRYPGDPDGPPAEIINCRCVRIAVAGPDPTDIQGNDPTLPY